MLNLTDSSLKVDGGTRIGWRNASGEMNLVRSTYGFGAHITVGDSESWGPSTGVINMDASTIEGNAAADPAGRNTNFHIGLRSGSVGTVNMNNGSVINMSGYIMYVAYNDDYNGQRNADCVGTLNMNDTAQFNNPTGNLETGAGGAMSKGTVNMNDMASMNLDFIGVGGDGGDGQRERL